MIRNLFAVGLAAALLAACGGGESEPNTAADATADVAEMTEIVVTDAELSGNPFREEWDTPYGIPPFDTIEDEHFMPAFKKAVLEMRADLDAIINNPDEPTFENTILAMETSGKSMTKMLYTFSSLTGTELNDNLRQLQIEIWPMWSRESDAIMLNETLFQRVSAVNEQRDSLDLGEQEARLLELTYRQFIRAGAALSPQVKEQIADINAELSELTTEFAQNLLAETKAFTIEITDAAETAGLADDFKANIRDEEKKAWVLGLNRSVYETFMTQSENRELREQLFNGYRLRASQGEYDNGPVLIRVAILRAQRAELRGYESHAHYQLETRMAKTPQAAENFLLQVWQPGLERAKEERADMQAMIGDEFTFAAHDWWHYSEKVRKARFDLDENELKPYFDLEAVRGGAFEMANRLFGLTFEAVDVPVWNEVVTAYDVKDENGAHLGVFMMDMYARDSKRGGAWMNSYRSASNIGGESIRPIITNNLNLATPPEGEPTLMRFSEVETLFHEFGHGLHGLMTQIDYPTFSGVDGPRDYTEFPAQLLEHWTAEPEMLELYARHYETGEVIPEELVERMLAAANHNQGFATTEYIAASLLDLRWHMLTAAEAAAITDAHAFEREVLEGYGLIDEIEPRYRSQYFAHTFAGGYSAGYYAYLWSEILDADGFNAFKEAEDIFDPETAARLKKWVYESGGLKEADELYRNFRGADPSIEPLLKGRGFDVTQTISD
ncbi:MAG: M3 family metallopeptidase [Proteobacteria bacterium]|nr:M3 family metallopeptidase [Pseudomonadota bacterium]